jgi:molybdenum cofactor cytidylyltransferase
MAISAIILAAGASQRMGQANKLASPWQGKAMVRRVVETALQSNVSETIVVTGHDVDAVHHVLDGLNVKLVHNPEYNEGLSTSLITGIDAVGSDQEGAAILLGDMPALRVETLNRLIDEFVQADGRCICVPVCKPRRGNPVLWPREFFADILELSGDRGACSLMEKFAHRVLEVPCDDDGILMDIDTPADMV